MSASRRPLVAVVEQARSDRIAIGLVVHQDPAERVACIRIEGLEDDAEGRPLLRSRPRPFQRIQGCVYGRIVLHAPYAPVVHREDAREAIRSSMASEQYAVPDDEDPIEDNLTEVLVMVCIERREQRSHRFEGCHRLRTYSRCPARQTEEADTNAYGHPYGFADPRTTDVASALPKASPKASERICLRPCCGTCRAQSHPVHAGERCLHRQVGREENRDLATCQLRSQLCARLAEEFAVNHGDRRKDCPEEVAKDGGVLHGRLGVPVPLEDLHSD